VNVCTPLAGGNPRERLSGGSPQHLSTNDGFATRPARGRCPITSITDDLPSSMTQALLDTVDALSPDARALAQALALNSGNHFFLRGVPGVCGHCSAMHLIPAPGRAG